MGTGTTHDRQARRVSLATNGLSLVTGPAVVIGLDLSLDWLTERHAAWASIWPWWQQVALSSMVVAGLGCVLSLVWAVVLLLTARRSARLTLRRLVRRVGQLVVVRVLTLTVLLVEVLAVWAIAREAPGGWLVVAPVFVLGELALGLNQFNHARLVNDLVPLDDERSLRILAEICGTPDGMPSAWIGHHRHLTSEINGFTLLNGTRRQVVLITDTALELPDRELRALLTRAVGQVELDHVRRRLVLLAVATGVAATAAMALTPYLHPLSVAADATTNEGLQGAVVPVRGLPLMVVNFVLLHYVTRFIAKRCIFVPTVLAQEKAADRFVLDRNQDPVGFASMIRSISLALGVKMGTAGQPGSAGIHPHPINRILMAQEWGREHGIEVDVEAIASAPPVTAG